MEAKHTPGPWKITTRDATNYKIESVSRKEFALSVTTSFQAEDLANAKLIAAAPDMLAALQELNINGFSLSLLDKIQSVIKKATA